MYFIILCCLGQVADCPIISPTMTKDALLKLCSGIDNCIFNRLSTLKRIKDIFQLKYNCKTLTYNVWFNGKQYSTYEELRDDLKKVDLRCTYTLSQPFVTKWNTFNYYVGVTYMFDYGHTIKDYHIRSIWTLRKKAFFETKDRKNKVPTGWYN